MYRGLHPAISLPRGSCVQTAPIVPCVRVTVTTAGADRVTSGSSGWLQSIKLRGVLPDPVTNPNRPLAHFSLFAGKIQHIIHYLKRPCRGCSHTTHGLNNAFIHRADHGRSARGHLDQGGGFGVNAALVIIIAGWSAAGGEQLVNSPLTMTASVSAKSFISGR